MSPRSVKQFEQLKGERRRSLLQAARTVFAKKGLSAAKIGEVAAIAGYSYGLVYHYFPHKDALFAAVVDDALQSWDQFFAMARQQPTPWERLAFVCTNLIRAQYQDPTSLLLVVRALIEEDAPPPVREVLTRYTQKVHEQIAGLIEEGQSAGVVAPGPPRELVRTLFLLVQGTAIDRVVDPAKGPPPMDLLLRFLKRE